MRFHEALVAELARRCEKNPRYSLRSFARQLGVDHSTLSQLVRGKRALTEATIRRLGTRLGVAEPVLAGFVAAEPDADARKQTQAATRDAARVFSDPLHAAILELTRAEGFKADVKWLTRMLGVEADTVQLAVGRLARLGLLTLRGDAWSDTTKGDVAAAARRTAQETMMNETGTPVMQWQILAKDPERAARFYSQAFGWSVSRNNALGYRQIDTGSARGIGGGIWPAPPEARAAVQLFIEVDALEPHLERVRAAGGTVAMAPQKLPDGDVMALVIDPEGLPVGLVERRPAGVT